MVISGTLQKEIDIKLGKILKHQGVKRNARIMQSYMIRIEPQIGNV
jgi:hypothetical protein